MENSATLRVSFAYLTEAANLIHWLVFENAKPGNDSYVVLYDLTGDAYGKLLNASPEDKDKKRLLFWAWNWFRKVRKFIHHGIPLPIFEDAKVEDYQSFYYLEGLEAVLDEYGKNGTVERFLKRAINAFKGEALPFQEVSEPVCCAGLSIAYMYSAAQAVHTKLTPDEPNRNDLKKALFALGSCNSLTRSEHWAWRVVMDMRNFASHATDSYELEKNRCALLVDYVDALDSLYKLYSSSPDREFGAEVVTYIKIAKLKLIQLLRSYYIN